MSAPWSPRRIAAALAGVVAAGAAVAYVARALRARKADERPARLPSAGRPLTVIRGGAEEG